MIIADYQLKIFYVGTLIFLEAKTMKFLKRLHPQKGVRWIIEQYFKPDKMGKSKNKWRKMISIR